jgi:hypothetical protein
LGFDGIDNLAEHREVSIVQTLPAGQLPNSFNRVEIGRVRWQVIEGESVRVLFPPNSMQPGMVIASLVGDNDHTPGSVGAGSIEHFQESKEGGAVEFARLAMEEELAIAKSNRAKVADAATRWMMKQYGSLVSGGIHIWQRERAAESAPRR